MDDVDFEICAATDAKTLKSAKLERNNEVVPLNQFWILQNSVYLFFLCLLSQFNWYKDKNNHKVTFHTKILRTQLHSLI